MNKWHDFIEDKRVNVNHLGKSFRQGRIDNPTPQKLLNYLTQNSETLLNVIQFSQIDALLRNKKTKIVLYTYDSILIDYCDEENLLDTIKSNLAFQFSIKSGKNYNEMEKM
jgi:hypothetical protein